MKAIVYTLMMVLLSTSLHAQQYNQKDSEGRKTGKWRQYHSTGKIRYTGTFVKGEPTGIFVYYNSAGSVVSKLIYTENGTVANAKLYYPDGKLHAEGVYKNKKKDGLWKYYHQKSGGKRAEESYKDDIRHGPWRIFFSNGKLASEENWANGVRHGSFKEFYENGDPKTIATYNNSRLEGQYIAYHPKRIVMKKGMYKSGKMDGLWTSYNSAGRVKRKVIYEFGKIVEQEVLIEDIQTPSDSIGDPRRLTIPPR